MSSERCDCEDCRYARNSGGVTLERLEAILDRAEKIGFASSKEAIDQIRTLLGLDKPKQRLGDGWKWHKDEHGDWWALFGETKMVRVVKNSDLQRHSELLVRTVQNTNATNCAIPVETIRGVLRHFGEGSC